MEMRSLFFVFQWILNFPIMILNSGVILQIKDYDGDNAHFRFTVKHETKGMQLLYMHVQSYNSE